MYSLNVPLPGAVRRQLDSLRPGLAGFETVREEPTLVVKRFGDLSPDEFEHVVSEARLALADVPAFEAQIDGLGIFEDPPSGPAPVVYLAVDSPELEQLHALLVDTFGAMEGLEGEAYVPHVTVARGGDTDALDSIHARDLESIIWTVTELWFWNARRSVRAGRVSLPR